jgi:hypothetical protein
MTRWRCEERGADPAALPSFDADGWRFDAAGSTPDKPLFVRA